MEQYSLKKPDSMKKKKRVGCGPSSGHGKTSCRGQKGQRSRSGSKSRPWFEGGQMPLQRRIPKRGFNNIFKLEYQIVNVSQLEKLSEGNIDPDMMEKAGIIKFGNGPVKVLGNGSLSKSITIVADFFSQSAQEKIQKAGGKAVVRAVPQDK
jgi:large subunit ribosomal protein L15